MSRVCNICDADKPLSEFSFRVPGQQFPTCKACRNEREKARYARQPAYRERWQIYNRARYRALPAYHAAALRRSREQYQRRKERAA